MDKKKLRNWVKMLFQDFHNQNGIEPTFEDIIRDCIFLKGIDKADYLFSSLKEGWIANNFPETDFRKLQNDIFCVGRNYCYTEMENALNSWHIAQEQIYFDSIIESENEIKI